MIRFSGKTYCREYPIKLFSVLIAANLLQSDCFYFATETQSIEIYNSMLNFNRIISNDSHSCITQNQYLLLTSIRYFLSFITDYSVKFLDGNNQKSNSSNATRAEIYLRRNGRHSRKEMTPKILPMNIFIMLLLLLLHETLLLLENLSVNHLNILFLTISVLSLPFVKTYCRQLSLKLV